MHFRLKIGRISGGMQHVATYPLWSVCVSYLAWWPIPRSNPSSVMKYYGDKTFTEKLAIKVQQEQDLMIEEQKAKMRVQRAAVVAGISWTPAQRHQYSAPIPSASETCVSAPNILPT